VLIASNSHFSSSRKGKRRGEREVKLLISRTELVIRFLAASSVFFLLATLPTSCIYSASFRYDPWADINDDGVINMKDISHVAARFMMTGTPLDKSNLSFPGYTHTPAFDSGWQPIGQDKYVIFTHNLNTKDVLVHMMGRVNESASPYIHQVDYGGELNYGLGYGAWWQDLTSSTITVHRRGSDGSWEQVRIIMWKIPG
jgi:hypothetical protein